MKTPAQINADLYKSALKDCEETEAIMESMDQLREVVKAHNMEIKTEFYGVPFVPKTPHEIQECCRKQKELVNKQTSPMHFAPFDGECFSCKKNIYQNYDMGTYVRYGQTGESLVTGCPHCNRSYCD